MRTTAFAPPFPIDLGTWIACFRHRLTDERGNPFSPEQLGKEIGVSGATIRRWEAGKLRPRPVDAANLARVCNLTSFQMAFLHRALRLPGPRPAVPPEDFETKATSILSAEFPMFIMDSLMFIRGWNSYLPHFLRRSQRDPRQRYHVVDFITDADENPGVHPMLRERIMRAVHELWYLTADVCGSDEYKGMLRHLCRNHVFREEWLNLAFLKEEDSSPIGLPRKAFREDIGQMLICPLVVVLPPIYHVRQFIPMDEVAKTKLDDLRSKGPPRVILVDDHAPTGRPEDLVLRNN